ncbi:hypothetical protein O181_030132 [Austropuccinia psidii MF-1]|uniref:Uncharacterized protein n=1 Tax=Austropuccinia psidii MF-1 TaxID=1389203 RepID=A0A9Q3CV59_9BASI|nr:hypothetical protein [Austropuccinia psidii MF-1]
MMRLAKSTLGLRDGYGDRNRMKRNELLPKLETEFSASQHFHPMSATSAGSPNQFGLVTPSSDHQSQLTSSGLYQGGVGTLESPRRRRLSSRLSIKSLRKWIHDQRREVPSISSALQTSLNVSACPITHTEIVNSSGDLCQGGSCNSSGSGSSSILSSVGGANANPSITLTPTTPHQYPHPRAGVRDPSNSFFDYQAIQPFTTRVEEDFHGQGFETSLVTRLPPYLVESKVESLLWLDQLEQKHSPRQRHV